MGGYLDKPDDRVHREEGVARMSQMRHGTACMQGWRPKMEDAHMAVFDIVDAHRRLDGVFAVFDGHGGKEVSQFCAEYLLKSLRANPQWQSPDVGVGECFRDALLRLDTSLVTAKGQASLQRLQNEEDVVVCIHHEIFSFLGTAGAPVPVLEPFARVPRRFSYKSTEPVDLDDDSSTASFEGFSPGLLDALYSPAPSPSPVDNEILASLRPRSGSLPLIAPLPSPLPPQPPLSVKAPGSELCELDASGTFPQRQSAPGLQGPSEREPLRTQSMLLDGDRRRPGTKRKRPISTPSELHLENRKRRSRKVLKRVNPVWERIRQIGVERGIAQKVSELSARVRRPPEKLPPAAPGARVSSGVGIEILPRAKLHLRDTTDMVVIDKGDLSSKVPGYDSGTTALIAVVEPTTDERVKRLTVINAGDSRCVLARGGEPVEMSVDHGPHLRSERARIERAGAIITSDGRIFGKLNLSRAIGDHRFKDRKHPLKEQAVTSWADIRETWVYEGIDEFMVLACDGIWDTMSSKEVVDFVRQRLARNLPLSVICEQLCRKCLAEDPEADPGTDNMSVVIVSLFPPKTQGQ